jgi:hypothetical protein
MERVIASGFVPPDGVTAAPDRRSPCRGEGMGECGSDEPGVGTNG